MPPRPRPRRFLLLIGLALLALVAALLLPAVPQPLAYHHFVDHRAAFGVANFADVASNLSFAVAGVAGLMAALRPRSCFAAPGERLPYLVFAIGLLLTAFGSGYYHLLPDNARLFWDRLPMTVAFMSLIAAQIVDRVDVRVGLLALVPLLLVGAASVLYWSWTEQQGRGNVMPYVVVQAFAAIVLLLLAIRYPSRYSGDSAIYVVLAGYVVAKLFEQEDGAIFALTGVVSGHTLKHVAAGVAALAVPLMLWRRRLR